MTFSITSIFCNLDWKILQHLCHYYSLILVPKERLDIHTGNFGIVTAFKEYKFESQITQIDKK